MNAKTRILMVGTSNWAKAHAASIARVPELQLVGVVGHSNRERLDALAGPYGVEGAFDLEAMLEKHKPEIVDLVCDPRFRLEGIAAAARHGVRLVNVEKPLALTLAELRNIQKLCRDTGIKVIVNHQKKLMRGWRDVGELLARGELGEVDLIWASCQGNLLEQGTHLVDMALYFNQYRAPRWVVGQVGDLEGLRKKGAAAPDMGLAEVAMVNGARCVFEFGTIGRAVAETGGKWAQVGVRVLAKKGTASATLSAGCEINFFDGKKMAIETSWLNDYPDGLDRHFKAAVASARDEAEHPSDLDHSVLSMEIVMGIYQSALSHAKIDLPTGLWDRDVVELLKEKVPSEKTP